MKPRVLVIDDEAVIARVITTFLARKGYETASAGSAEDGIALAIKEKFGVILLDNSLPGITGMQAIEKLRSCGAGVVLMTGHFDEQVRADGLALGAVEVVGKPLDFGGLEGLIAAAAGRPQI